MRINLAPVRSETTLFVSLVGERLTVNGVEFDLCRLGEGDTLPATALDSQWFFHEITRTDGAIELTLLLPWGPNAPESTRFPEPILTTGDGRIDLPAYDDPAPEIIDLGTTKVGVIDWSQMITAEMKAQAAAEQLLTSVVTEIAQRRATADTAIAPLQDAVDLDMATDAEAALLKDWKRYRVALNRLAEQSGYPADIDWPATPA